MSEIEIESTAKRQVLDITEKVNETLKTLASQKGGVLLFIKHTTAALAVTEMGEGTGEDFQEVVEKIIPQINFRHGHNPSHAPDHMIGSLLGPSLVLPVKDGKLDLGTWQSVVVVEQNGPRNLTISCTVF